MLLPILRRVAPWQLFAFTGGVAALVCGLLPAGVLHDAVFASGSCAAAVAVAVGARWHRPQRSSAWWCLAAGLGAWGLGDISYAVVHDVLGSNAYPSAADWFHVLAYPLMGAAMLRLARQARPGRDLEGVIDATVLAVGFGLVSWAFLIAPALARVGDDPLAGTVSLLYPLGDLLVLAMLVRVFAAAGHRSAAFGLLASAAVLMLVADAVRQYADAYLHTGAFAAGQSATDPSFLASYVLWGCAALHPSMRRLSDPLPSVRHEFSRARLGVLTTASLLAPGTLALMAVLGRPLHVWAVVVASTVLLLLVVARMSLLLRRLRAQAGQLTTLARTDPLTGLLNRRSADAEMERMRNRALLDRSALSVAIIDLDRFKLYNDTHGHPAGDRLLVGAAKAWRISLAGTGAALARWGGEEFVVMAVGLAPARVEQLLGDLRAVVPEGQSFSAGLARWDGCESLGDLLVRADAALYAAKSAGRARTCTAAGDGAGDADGGGGRGLPLAGEHRTA